MKTQATLLLGACLLGAWIAGTLIMFFVATQNFRTVDRVLDRPTSQAAGPLRAVAHDPLRMLLRHLSSELNRLYFLTWGGAQLVLGVTLFWTLRGKDRILAGAMLLMTAGLLFFVTPSITEIGRQLDFVPRNPLPEASAPLMATFWKLHFAYTGLEGVKLVLGFVLAWRLSK